ncbi:MAG: hypothetical protein IJV07_04660 [Alphaproteobacteria bacterium]|nr:hypothetical protein [Alphaproteobacteria bacterium]
MNWWSAKNLCSAHGLNLFTVEDIDCYFDNNQKVTTGSGKTVYCCRKNESCLKEDWKNMDKMHLFSQEIIDICQSYPDPFYPWLASQHNGADNQTRSAYGINCPKGYVGSIDRAKTNVHVLCH